MSQYKYVTVLEAQSDGKAPNDNMEKGDKILKAGRHDTDEIEYIAEDKDIDVIEFEAVKVFEADKRMSERAIQEYGKEQWFA